MKYLRLQTIKINKHRPVPFGPLSLQVSPWAGCQIITGISYMVKTKFRLAWLIPGLLIPMFLAVMIMWIAFGQTRLSSPNLQYALIHGAVFALIALPVSSWAGRKRVDYRLFFYAAANVVFAVGFYLHLMVGIHGP
ncbi:MAG: hypothetical protein LBM04_04250 [Opitutaceae bacterium]|jgi:hypothetical protein|nr:hypothetical protein [Opitutaceae bacterium]